MCGLTNAKPEFVSTCPEYENDPIAVKRESYGNANERKSNLDQYRASGGKRFANYIIDIIAYYIILVFLGFIIGIIDYSLIDSAFISVSPYAILILYYLVFEATTGQTIGKYISGTIVVGEDGANPPVGRVIGRTFVRFIPFEAFSFLGQSSSGWHDSLTKTKVIDKKGYQQKISDNTLLDENLYN